MTLISDPPVAGEPAPVSHVVVASKSDTLATRMQAILEGTDSSVEAVTSVDKLEQATIQVPDMVILDAAPPNRLTTTDVSRLRHRWPSALIVVVGVADEAGATELLNAGADDAIERQSGWPYAAARLGASARRTRLANAMLRRRVGDVVYDRDNRRVWCAGEEVEFSPRELALLDALWIRAGELVHHDSLHDYVWADPDDGERSNRLEVYISYIRRKLQRSNEVTIQTLRGAGYRLVRKNAVDSPWQRDEEDS